MRFMPYLNTCDRPLTPGTPLYPISIHAVLTPPPPGGRVAHYIATQTFKNQAKKSHTLLRVGMIQ